MLLPARASAAHLPGRTLEQPRRAFAIRGRLAAALALLALAIAPLTACGPKLDDLAAGEKGQVAAVQDGDTLTLDSGLKVHLAGIEAPRRGWPSAGEARAALEKAALGRAAELRYGGERRSRSGAALAQVFVRSEGGRTIWLQEELVRAGLARVHTRKDNAARADRLLALEAAARKARRGIWADPFYAVHAAEAVGPVEGFALVEGVVRRVAPETGRTYFNFGDDIGSDFTLILADEDAAAFTGDRAPAALVGKHIRVRGMVRDRGGPMMRLDHPAQIEVLGSGRSRTPPASPPAVPSAVPTTPAPADTGDARGMSSDAEDLAPQDPP